MKMTASHHEKGVVVDESIGTYSSKAMLDLASVACGGG
jgi:hypothetical protein